MAGLFTTLADIIHYRHWPWPGHRTAAPSSEMYLSSVWNCTVCSYLSRTTCNALKIKCILSVNAPNINSWMTTELNGQLSTSVTKPSDIFLPWQCARYAGKVCVYVHWLQYVNVCREYYNDYICIWNLLSLVQMFLIWLLLWPCPLMGTENSVTPPPPPPPHPQSHGDVSASVPVIIIIVVIVLLLPAFLRRQKQLGSTKTDKWLSSPSHFFTV